MSELPVEGERPERCETCRFWDTDDEIGKGECHRRCPTIVLFQVCPQDVLKDQAASFAGGGHPVDEASAVWPRTFPSDWCGEWQSRAAPADPVVPHNPVLDVQIDGFGFSHRVVSSLYCGMDRRRIVLPNGTMGDAPLTIGDLISLTSGALRSFHNFGPTCLQEVRERLAKNGLFLLDDSPPPKPETKTV